MSVNLISVVEDETFTGMDSLEYLHNSCNRISVVAQMINVHRTSQFTNFLVIVI